jgi:hypothetical protein
LVASLATPENLYVLSYQEYPELMKLALEAQTLTKQNQSINMTLETATS